MGCGAFLAADVVENNMILQFLTKIYHICITDFILRINTRADLPEELVEDTILHEMIHYFIAVNQLHDTRTHGQIFRREMKRINEMGGRHISISYRPNSEQLAQLRKETE